MMDVEELYFTENLNQSMDVLYMPSVLFWQLLRYMIIYWIYEQTVSEMSNVGGQKRILPSNKRSRYNHESFVSGSVK